MADPFESTPATQPTSWPEGILCLCGNPDNCSCPPAPERMPPDDTTAPAPAPAPADGLRDRMILTLHEQRGHGHDLPTCPVLADAILAALAGDPGDLPAQMREAVLKFFGHDGVGRTDTTVKWAEAIAAAALSVRWAHAAHLAARVGDAERRAEHAESEHQVTQDRLADAATVNRGLRPALESAEAERDALKAARSDVLCRMATTRVWAYRELTGDARSNVHRVIDHLWGILDPDRSIHPALAIPEPSGQRCGSCDHLTEHHQPEGCWYAVTTGADGRDLVCPCTVPDTALDGGE